MSIPVRGRRALVTALTLLCLLATASAQSARKQAAGTSKLSPVALAPQAPVWSSIPAMPTARYLLGAATINNKLYAVGGASGGGTPYNKLEVFDPATNAWTTAAPMPTARYGIGAAALGGKLYVVGGFVGGAYSNKVEIYDPATDSWTTGPNMQLGHFYVAAAVLNGKLYAMGGYDPNGPSNKVEVFDPVANSWSYVAPMSATRYALGAAALNGKLYAVGGYGSTGPLTSMEVYDPVANSWSGTQAMTARRSYVATAVLNNKIYAMGGFNNTAIINSVEVYDPTANSWTAGPAMLSAREAPGAAVVNNKLYAVGGIAVTGSTTTVNSGEVLAAVVNPGDVLISEYRPSGPAGAQDEFVELYNNTDAPILVDTLDGSAGWTLATATGALVTIPNGTSLAARGHLLCANNTSGTGYSLGTLAAADINYTADIADNAGVALFRTANTASFTMSERLDAAGPAAEANTLYREGNGAAMIGGGATMPQYSFVRDLSSGLPKDTGDNAADFITVDASGANVSSSARLGAPAPENAASPVQRNATVKALLVDPQQAATAAPNRVRDLTSGGVGTATEFGTLSLRRKFKNNTGAPVTRLRFRVVQITTNQASAPAGQADLSVLDGSGSFIVNLTGGGTDTVQRLALEQPADAVLGGGHNAGLLAGTVTSGTALAAGATINVEFLLGVAKGGSYSFLVNVEALP